MEFIYDATYSKFLIFLSMCDEDDNNGYAMITLLKYIKNQINTLTCIKNGQTNV